MADETSGDDILEQGSGRFRLPDWRPSRRAQALAVVALLTGLAAGYAAGSSGARGNVARPQPTVTVTASPSAPAPAASFSFASSPLLTQDTAACSMQASKNELNLGIRLTNQSPARLALTTVKAVLPLGGLKQIAWHWGTCGAVHGVPGPAADILLPGQSVWLTVTFLVQLHCPGPLPVQFNVGYRVAGRSATASLPGFPDLTQVPYSGCASTGSGASNSEIIGVSP